MQVVKYELNFLFFKVLLTSLSLGLACQPFSSQTMANSLVAIVLWNFAQTYG